MGQGKIVFKEEVIDYTNELMYELYQKEYFGFYDSAVNYKDKIIDFVLENLISFPSKRTPVKIQHLGSNYIFYKINSYTTWFIFFEFQNDEYLVTYITNNHSKWVSYLNN